MVPLKEWLEDRHPKKFGSMSNRDVDKMIDKVEKIIDTLRVQDQANRLADKQLEQK